ncbi:LexA family protein [Aureimonas pseudogalii]|uniref:LexA family protein n=1 Tax=Aureimonas pseudogalii TaxID=1744844 RepID=UPI00160695B5
MTYGLTARQHHCLSSIRDHVERTGVPPSYDELCVALDVASKATVHRLIKALEERGHITRLVHHARSIALVDQAASSVNERVVA